MSDVTDLEKELIEAREQLALHKERCHTKHRDFGRLEMEWSDMKTKLAAATERAEKAERLNRELSGPSRRVLRAERDALQARLDRLMADTLTQGAKAKGAHAALVLKLEEVTRERDDLQRDLDVTAKQRLGELMPELGRTQARLARAVALLREIPPRAIGGVLIEWLGRRDALLAESAPAAEVKCTCQPCNCYSTDCQVHG